MFTQNYHYANNTKHPKPDLRNKGRKGNAGL